MEIRTGDHAGFVISLQSVTHAAHSELTRITASNDDPANVRVREFLNDALTTAISMIASGRTMPSPSEERKALLKKREG